MLEEVKKNKSRREYLPLLGRFVELTKAEHLHCANNAWGALSELMLQEAHNRTRLPSQVKLLKDMPHECTLRRFVRALECKVRAHRLHKKLMKDLDAEDTARKVRTILFLKWPDEESCS